MVLEFLIAAAIGVLPSPTSAVLQSGQCANAYDIQPCVCSNEALYSLQCEHLTNEMTLQNVLLIPEVQSINLTSSVLPYFPTRVFENTRIRFLYLQSNILEDLFDIPTLPTNDLRHLVIRHTTPKKGWQWEQFSSFTSLRTLVVYNSNVGDAITASDFGRYVTKGVKSVSLIGAGIKSIEAGSFHGFTNMTYLRLSGNKLRTLGRSSLPTPSSRLVSLKLDHNELSRFADDMFVDMPFLRDIRLGYNNIAILSEAVYGKIWNRNTSLQIQGNSIKCDCTLMWSLAVEQRPRLLRGICSHPKQLYGQELTSLSTASLNCTL